MIDININEVRFLNTEIEMDLNKDISKKTKLKTDLKLTLRSPYRVTIRKGQDGYVVAKCSELHVVSQGKTEEDAIMDAIEFMESVLEEQGKNKAFSIRIKRN